MKIKISPYALNDLDESIKYYNLQKEELGNDFAKNIDKVLKRIKNNPNQFPVTYKEMRIVRTEKFPFNVFFVVKGKTNYVLGIFHTSRNPKIMKDRYKSL